LSFALQPVRVATGTDEEGMLVFDGEQRLVAVLTYLSDENEIAPKHWYLETGFGALEGIDHPVFADLEQAQDWITRRLANKYGRVADKIP